VFSGPSDFNTQITAWLVKANARHSRRIGCAPAARWATDRDAMLRLPLAPPAVGWRTRVRLPRDHYVRLASNDYSVDPSVVGRFVDVAADLTTVTITCAAVVVGRHQRCWARHQTITDPAHRDKALELAHRARVAKAQSPPQAGVVVEARDLSVYDAVFGTVSGTGTGTGTGTGEVA
jgi:hypothetical protein